MNKLFDLVRVTTASTGTGATITLGAAVAGGFLTFGQGGVADGDTVTYAIDDAAGGKEIGPGVYNAAGTTLTRGTPYKSSGAGFNTRISLSGNAQVMITAAAEDFGAITLGGTAFRLGDTVASISGLTLSGATLTNVPQVTGSGGNNTAALIISDAGNSAGVNLRLIGNGVSTPKKTVRVFNGILSVANDAYTLEILSLTDVGNLLVSGTITNGTGGTLTGITLAGTTNFPGGQGSGITTGGNLYLGGTNKLLLGNAAGDAPITHSNTLLPAAIGSGAALTDAKQLFYELGAANWAGEGVDSSGNYWRRTGLSGGGNYLVQYANGGVYIGPSPTSPGAGNLLVNGTVTVGATDNYAIGRDGSTGFLTYSGNQNSFSGFTWKSTISSTLTQIANLSNGGVLSLRLGISVGGDITGTSTASAYTIGANPTAIDGGFVQVYGSTHASSAKLTLGYAGGSALSIDASLHATFAGTVKTGVTTVAGLPTAGTAGRQGAVNNATQTLTAGIGAIVAGGGANTVPVFDDGTNWRIG